MRKRIGSPQLFWLSEVRIRVPTLHSGDSKILAKCLGAPSPVSIRRRHRSPALCKWRSETFEHTQPLAALTS